jgi:hypothetical protein
MASAGVIVSGRRPVGARPCPTGSGPTGPGRYPDSPLVAVAHLEQHIAPVDVAAVPAVVPAPAAEPRPRVPGQHAVEPALPVGAPPEARPLVPVDELPHLQQAVTRSPITARGRSRRRADSLPCSFGSSKPDSDARRCGVTPRRCAASRWAPASVPVRRRFVKPAACCSISRKPAPPIGYRLATGRLSAVRLSLPASRLAPLLAPASLWRFMGGKMGASRRMAT